MSVVCQWEVLQFSVFELIHRHAITILPINSDSQLYLCMDKNTLDWYPYRSYRYMQQNASIHYSRTFLFLDFISIIIISDYIAQSLTLDVLGQPGAAGEENLVSTNTFSTPL